MCGAPGSARVGMVGDAQTVRFLVTRYNSVCINNEIFLYYILVYVP